MLESLNTRSVANVGLAVGAAAIVAAVGAFFKVISDPGELIALYEAAHTHADPTGAVAKLVGAGIGVVGAFTIALLAAYLGKPSTLPK